jgi:outer membrane protein OmpA-like peptidoglycan-associated protein
MESQISSRLALMVATAALLSGCTSTINAPAYQGGPAAPPIRLGVEQVGSGESTRYVYCVEERCSAVTPKTPGRRPLPVAALAPASAQSAPMPSVPRAADLLDLDVSFDFNSSTVHTRDRDRIASAASRSNARSVVITGRSDYVGPAARQQAIAAARAVALRKVVAGTLSQRAPITETFEIAASQRVPAEQQALQRRGTVRFVLSSTTFPGE